jgi:hypothetical protein
VQAVEGSFHECRAALDAMFKMERSPLKQLTKSWFAWKELSITERCSAIGHLESPPNFPEEVWIIMVCNACAGDFKALCAVVDMHCYVAFCDDICRPPAERFASAAVEAVRIYSPIKDLDVIEKALDKKTKEISGCFAADHFRARHAMEFFALIIAVGLPLDPKIYAKYLPHALWLMSTERSSSVRYASFEAFGVEIDAKEYKVIDRNPETNRNMRALWLERGFASTSFPKCPAVPSFIQQARNWLEELVEEKRRP